MGHPARPRGGGTPVRARRPGGDGPFRSPGAFPPPVRPGARSRVPRGDPGSPGESSSPSRPERGEALLPAPEAVSLSGPAALGRSRDAARRGGRVPGRAKADDVGAQAPERRPPGVPPGPPRLPDRRSAEISPAAPDDGPAERAEARRFGVRLPRPPPARRLGREGRRRGSLSPVRPLPQGERVPSPPPSVHLASQATWLILPVAYACLKD